MNEEEKQSLIAGIKSVIEEKTRKSDEVVAEISKRLDEDREVSGQLKDALAKANEENQKLYGRLADVEQKFAEFKVSPAGPAEVKSVGQKFIESDELKEFVARGGKGHSGAFAVKAITSITGSGGAGIWSDRLAGVVQDPDRRLTIRDLCDSGTTSSNLIEWIKEDSFTNSADVVSEGALKPESDIEYRREDVPVRTIAHWIHATRQVLADFPQLMTLINGRLMAGLKIKEEDQLLLGDGTGENIKGLIPNATSYNVGLSKPGDTMIDTIRHAILQVRLSQYSATGIVVTPTEWHNIELTKDGNNRYLMANPAGNLPAMLWGRPVVESDAMPAGEFLVGAFKLAATVFDREQANIAVSTEDRSNFVTNMVTILCEERLALAVSRDTAFVHGTFPSASST